MRGFHTRPRRRTAPRWWSAGVVAGLLAAVVATAHAAVGDISVGGVWVCRLTTGIRGLGLEQRVAEVERRITQVLSTPEYRGRGVGVLVRPAGADAEIVVGQMVVMVVTPADAAGTGVSTRELARQWARRLVTGLNRALPGAQFNVL